MSCWVVPTIAAELWGVTLDHVLGRVGDGTVPSKTEHGFMLVDVAPQSEFFSPSRPPQRGGPRLTTFSVLTPSEYAALHGQQAPVREETPAEEEDAREARPNDMPRDGTPPHADLPNADLPIGHLPNAHLPDAEIPEDEAGPDPNDEPDDGKPLRWREGRARAAFRRRRPSMA